MRIINSWADTLTAFLKSSNEDERVCALFEENILPQLAKTFKGKNLNWLEVGAGDGNKTKQIANAINSLQQFKNINLTICEPSMDWLVSLQGSTFTKQLPVNIDLDFANKTIEEFVATEKEVDYDFISIIQVMYSASIKDAMLNYIDNKPKGKPCLIWVDVEDKSADFHKMRERLMQKGKAVVHSFADELIHDLKQRNIKSQTFLTTNKVCYINKQEVLSKDNHWLFPFVLGYDIEDFAAMSKSDKSLVRKELRNYVSKLEKSELKIPDISVLIFVE